MMICASSPCCVAEVIGGQGTVASDDSVGGQESSSLRLIRPVPQNTASLILWKCDRDGNPSNISDWWEANRQMDMMKNDNQSKHRVIEMLTERRDVNCLPIIGVPCFRDRWPVNWKGK
jgi:hypothetical protein